MGLLLWLIRSFAALILGIVIFAGFAVFLTVNGAAEKLFSADFYIDTLAEEDTYNRIYDEVLMDAELQDTTQEWLGNVEVVSEEEARDLLREIIPPDYLRQQVEISIQSAIRYLNEETDQLEVYVDLSPSLERVKPTLFNYIDRRFDAIALREPDPNQSAEEQAEAVWAQLMIILRGLAEGQLPQSLPSLQAIPPELRDFTFDAAFRRLLQDESLDQRIKDGLIEKEEELRREFGAGDSREMLKLAARPVATPAMDDAIANIRIELAEGDRLYLLRLLDKWNDNVTEAEIRQDIDDVRQVTSWSKDFGTSASLALVIGGAVLMGLLFTPNLSSMLRWPGLTLMFVGGFFYVAARIAQSEIPQQINDLIVRERQQANGVPPSAHDLGGDIMISFVNNLVSGFDEPALILLVVGAVIFGLSFLLLMPRSLIPFRRPVLN